MDRSVAESVKASLFLPSVEPPNLISPFVQKFSEIEAILTRPAGYEGSQDCGPVPSCRPMRLFWLL